jgi:hypothetical protein
MPTPATPEALEHWLYEQRGWVSREHICQLFDIAERDLRPRDNKAGLLDGFAVSRPTGGYIHIDHATDDEFGAHVNRKRSAGQSLIDNTDALIARRLAGPRHPLTQPSLL